MLCYIGNIDKVKGKMLLLAVVILLFSAAACADAGLVH
jgi:hypothetical protein